MIVVIGDVLLDRETRGEVKRLAPDAPVPVLSNLKESVRLGGAGLAAWLLREMGEEVLLIAPIGNDRPSREIRSLCNRSQIDLFELPTSGATRVKERLSTDEQILMRVDHGDEDQAPTSIPVEIAEIASKADAVLVSDYGGGVTRDPLIRSLVGHLTVPVVWDPHPKGAEPVAGLTLVTPNRSESGAVADVGKKAMELVSRWQTAVAITVGELGAYLSVDGIESEYLPAARVNGDPCGAGDAFASAAVMGLAHGLDVRSCVVGAVEAATAWVSREKWSERAPILVATGGCFDLLHVGHIETLKAAKALGDRLIVLINSDQSVRQLKGPSRPFNSAKDRAKVLASLEFVDEVIIFDQLTPEHAIAQLRPDIWVKGGDYRIDDLPETAVMARWGGRVVITPYVNGYSTSAFAEQSAI